MPRPHYRASTLAKAVEANSQTAAFRVLPHESEEPSNWHLLPMDVAVLSYDGSGGGFYIVRALQVLPDGKVSHCLMDVSYPERINDYSYFVENSKVRYARTAGCDGEIIPAIAFDCFGSYETFYTKSNPELGLGVLKGGLASTSRKRYIAQDLGYILRDEKRYGEAAEMFEIVVAEEAPSYVTFGELAGLYKKLGDSEREAKYRELYNRGGRSGA